MIFAANLHVPVKKVMGAKCAQSTVNTIIKNLVLDPEVTNMDAVILGPKDATGPRVSELNNAIANKHPDICVIYIYNKDAEKNLIECEYKKFAKKTKDSVISQVVEEFLGNHLIRTGKTFVSQADFQSIDKTAEEEEEPVRVAPPKGSFMKPRRPLGKRNLESAQIMSKCEETAERIVYRNPNEEQPDPRLTEDTMQISMPSIDTLMQAMSEKTEAPVSEPSEVPSITESSADVPEVASDMKVEATNVSEEPAVTDTRVTDSPVAESVTDSVSEPIPEVDEPMIPEIVLPPEPEIPCNTHNVKQAELPEMPPSLLESFDANVQNIKSYEDWQVFKGLLDRDTTMKRLIQANDDFACLTKTLDILEQQARSVFRDETLSAEEKFNKIKEIGMERSVQKAAHNSIYVDKLIETMDMITRSAKRTVEEKIETINAAMSKIMLDRSAIEDSSYLDSLIQKRADIQYELLDILRELVSLYKAMDFAVNDELKNLDSGLPSDSAYINEMISAGENVVFTPINTAALANKLLQALSTNRLTASQLEQAIQNLTGVAYSLSKADEEIINEQQKFIERLKANRVGDTVIVNSVIKETMNIFIGSDNSGRSATAITYSGTLSRRRNVLVIDFSGTPKFETYGLTSVTLEKFMQERIEKQILAVYSPKPVDIAELSDFIAEVKSRLNYYSSINVILSTDQIEALNVLTDDAKNVYYVTSCTPKSLEPLTKLISKFEPENIAQNLVTIATPVSPIMIAKQVGIDIQKVKLIPIPESSEIKGCTLKHDRPYEYSTVSAIFEEAFK